MPVPQLPPTPDLSLRRSGFGSSGAESGPSQTQVRREGRTEHKAVDDRESESPAAGRAAQYCAVTITVNGGERTLPEGASVSDLLAEMKLSPRQVAVEVNRRLRRAREYDQPLAPGDRVEVVTFVGGG